MRRFILSTVCLVSACARVPAAADPEVSAVDPMTSSQGPSPSDATSPGSTADIGPRRTTPGRDIRRLPVLEDMRYADMIRLDLEREIQGRRPEDPQFGELAFRLALHLQAMAETWRDVDPVAADAHENRARELLVTMASAPALAGFRRMDEVLFMLAHLQRDVDPQGAAKTMRALIMDHPGSDFVGAAYLAFGQRYFDKHELVPAVRLFEKATQISGPDQAYAWVMIGKVKLDSLDDTGQPPFAEALHAFFRAWEATHDSRAVRSPEDAELVRREAGAGLVAAYPHAGVPRKAGDFFQRAVGAQRVVTLLEQLRERYIALDDAAAAREICAAIRKRASGHSCAP